MAEHIADVYTGSVYPQLRPEVPMPYYQMSPVTAPFVPASTVPTMIPTPVEPVAPPKKGLGNTLKNFFKAIVAPGAIDFNTDSQVGLINAPVPILTNAPSAPLPVFAEEHDATSSRVFQFYQEIRSRAPVDRLLRASLSTDLLINSNIDLNPFLEAGYTLPEMRQLIPQYNDMRRLGLNKHYFGQKWDIKVFSQVYQVNVLQLITELQLTPNDLCKHKFTAAELGQLGFTAKHLIKAGADFEFWIQLQATPKEFSKHLQGTISDVVSMNLNLTQKQAMGTLCCWEPTEVMNIEGFTARSAVKLWYGFNM
jgi:hypothetical protein